MEDEEGRHGAHIVLLGHVALVVDVDLAERDLLGLGVLGREGLEGRRNRLTWSAPVGIN